MSTNATAESPAPEAPPKAVPLEKGAAAPFTGDLVPAGQLQTLLEKYVRLRSERDQLRAELDGEHRKRPELERLAEERGAVMERHTQVVARAELEKQLAQAAVERDSARERVKWYGEHYDAATAWYRQPMFVVVLTVVGLVVSAVGTVLVLNFFLKLTDYYLAPPRPQ